MTGTIFAGGPILSMDADDTRPEAIGILADRIVSVGALSHVRNFLPNAAFCDLAGRVLIPAFIDSHGHFPDSAIVSLLRVDLSGRPVAEALPMSATALQERLRKHRPETG